MKHNNRNGRYGQNQVEKDLLRLSESILAPDYIGGRVRRGIYLGVQMRRRIKLAVASAVVAVASTLLLFLTGNIFQSEPVPPRKDFATEGTLTEGALSEGELTNQLYPTNVTAPQNQQQATTSMDK